MNKQLKQLEEFHEVFKSVWNDSPTEIDEKTKKMRIALMREELEELVEAMENESIEDIAKEIADLLYVTYGTIGAYGLQNKMEEIFSEVHRSNMSKLGENGELVLREDGKVLRGPNYTPAKIKEILNHDRRF